MKFLAMIILSAFLAGCLPEVNEAKKEDNDSKERALYKHRMSDFGYDGKEVSK